MRASPLLLSVTLFCSGCATLGPDYQRPQAETAAEFQGLNASAGVNADSTIKLAEWWKSLNDPLLNQLVDQALENNLDLKLAQSRLRQARAERGVAKSGLLPSLGASGSAGRSGTTTTVSNNYAVGFDSAWEIDLFGGKTRAVESADALLESSQESLRDTLVSVLSELALNYVDLRSFEERLAIAQANISSQQKNYELVQSQFEAGLIEELAVEQARGNLEATRAQLPSLETNLQQARNRIATLLGRTAGSLDADLASAANVPKPPVEIAVGIPAEMLRRRPDVRQAERLLAAATAQIGVAQAARYPSFSLNGSVGLESLASGNLFDMVSRVFNLRSLINWDFFQGGKLRSAVEIKTELQQQAFINWEAAVLNASEEVENALTAYANEQLRYHSLERAAQANSKAATLARSRYDAGITNFLEVLDADRSRLSAEDTLAISKGLITANLIRLYKALGGGWESLLPSEEAQ